MPRGNGNKPALRAMTSVELGKSWNDIHERATAYKAEILPSAPSLSSLAGRVSKLHDELWSSINALTKHGDEVFGPQIEDSAAVGINHPDVAGSLSVLEREIAMVETTLQRLAREVGRFAGHA